MITEFPTLSIRKIASATNILTTLVYHILHGDFHLKPYKLHEWHKLEPQDYPKRLEFAHWFLKLPEDTKFHFICSDEAYFYLSLPLNKQNNRIWSDSQPYCGIEMPLHDEKVLVWCAISADRVFGPYFFENTVKKENYLEMIQTFFWPKILRTSNYQKYYFQQDGATPHTADKVQNWLTRKFSDKFLNKKMWPPRSPDLNPCDYYLWGHLKSVVYNPLPKTLDDLKQNITRDIKKISKKYFKFSFFKF